MVGGYRDTCDPLMTTGAEMSDANGMSRVETLRLLRHELRVQNYDFALTCIQRCAQFPQTDEQRKTREALRLAVVEREHGQDDDIGAEWADFHAAWFDAIGNPILPPSHLPERPSPLPCTLHGAEAAARPVGARLAAQPRGLLYPDSYLHAGWLARGSGASARSSAVVQQ